MSPENAEQLRSTTSSELPARNTADATDYRQALSGARRQLERRAEAVGGDSACKLLLWFTDGALDVDEQTGVAADELCRERGIADSLRADNINIVALALFSRGSSVTREQREQLRSVAEGASPSGSCGIAPIPDRSASGAYLAADEADALRRLFARAGALIAGGTFGETVTCPGSTCRGSRLGIDLDPGMSGFRAVLVLPDDLRAPVVIETPTGTLPVDLGAGTTSARADGATVQTTARPGLLNISVTLDSMATSSSRWIVDLGGQQAEADLYWLWGAELVVPEPAFVIGEPQIVSGQITDGSDEPLPVDLYAEVRAEVTVGHQSAAAQVEPDGSFRAELPAPDGKASASVPVVVQVESTTRGSSRELGPLTSNMVATTTLPASFPSISPRELDLGTATGVDPVTARIEVTGSDATDAEVCVGNASVISADGTDVDVAADPNGCFLVQGSESSVIELLLTPQEAVDGLADGVVDVQMTSRANGDEVVLSVPVSFTQERPVNEAVRWLLVALLTVIAVAVPILILLVGDWFGARFVITPLHQYVNLPVLLTAAGPTRRDGSPLSLTGTDLQNLPESRTRRVRHFANDVIPGSLRARGLWNIVQGSTANIVAPDGTLVAAERSALAHADARSAPSDFGPIDTWWVVVPQASIDEGAVAATLVCVTADLTPAVLSELVEAAQWDTLLAHLRAAVPATREQSLVSVGGSSAEGYASAADAGSSSAPDWMDDDAHSSDRRGASEAAAPSWIDDDDTSRPSRRSDGSPSSRTKDDSPRGATPPPDIDFLD